MSCPKESPFVVSPSRSGRFSCVADPRPGTSFPMRSRVPHHFGGDGPNSGRPREGWSVWLGNRTALFGLFCFSSHEIHDVPSDCIGDARQPNCQISSFSCHWCIGRILTCASSPEVADGSHSRSTPVVVETFEVFSVLLDGLPELATPEKLLPFRTVQKGPENRDDSLYRTLETVPTFPILAVSLLFHRFLIGLIFFGKTLRFSQRIHSKLPHGTPPLTQLQH